MINLIFYGLSTISVLFKVETYLALLNNSFLWVNIAFNIWSITLIVRDTTCNLEEETRLSEKKLPENNGSYDSYAESMASNTQRKCTNIHQRQYQEYASEALVRYDQFEWRAFAEKSPQYYSKAWVVTNGLGYKYASSYLTHSWMYYLTATVDVWTLYSVSKRKLTRNIPSL